MPPTPHPDRAASAAPAWYKRRRSIVALLLVVLLLGLRAALPSVLRSQIEKQANAAIAGQLSVGDVDLWLLSGAMALKDVVMRAETTAPDAPPVLELQRLYARVSYWSLLRRIVHIKDLVLEGPAVHLERLASGVVAFPGLRAVPGASPAAMPTTTPSRSEVPGPEPATAKPADSQWNLVIDQLMLRAGRISVRDHVSDPPKSAELSLGTLSFRDFTLLRSEERAPGRGTIEAKFGDGTVRIDTTVTTRAEGYAFEATLDLADLPLDRMQQHVPQLGWSTLTGRLDAHLTLRAEPHELPSSSGTVALRDLRIEVPGESEPALGWRKLAIDIEEFGIIRRRAIVKRVSLERGVVVVTPKGVAPLPLLRGAAEGEAASKTSPAPLPATTRSAPSESLQPWVWRFGTIDVVDTRASIVLPPSTLAVEIARGTITGLESTPGAQAAVDLQLQEERGSLGLKGKVGIDPPAAQLSAKLASLALTRLLAATGVPLPVELPNGTLSGDVTIQAGRGPLIVSGKLAVADLGVRLPKGAEFAVDCKRLEVGIKQVRVPGVLGGAAPQIPEQVRVDLDSLKLVAPAVTLTRTADGLVLPSGNPPRSPTTTPPAPVAKAKSTEPSKAVAPAAASASPIAISLAVLDLQGGQLNVVDRTVKPLYRGKVSALTLKARGIRVPQNVFNDIALSATLPGGAPLRADAKQTNGVITFTANGREIPLQQFNPYVTPASGYSISEGRLSLNSSVRWAPDKYESTTEMEFDQLGMAGAEGDSLFLQKVGIPLQLALSLLRDLNGKISLTVPVSGDKGGTQVAIGEIVAQALVKAILGAVTSPLKMLGVVADLATGGGGGAPVLPEPIHCVPGLPVIETSADARVQQLGDALGGAPALRITLRGMAGGPDVRALQEAAVLGDLNAKQGVIGGLKSLANRSERNAIRDFLTARAGGGSAAELSADYRKTLDEWAQAKTVDDDQLRVLASARAEAAKNALVTRQGVDATRVAVGDPQIDRENGKPAVHIAFNPP